MSPVADPILRALADGLLRLAGGAGLTPAAAAPLAGSLAEAPAFAAGGAGEAAAASLWAPLIGLGVPPIVASWFLPVQGGSGSLAGAEPTHVLGPNGHPLWKLADGQVVLGGPRGPTGVAVPALATAAGGSLTLQQYAAFEHELLDSFAGRHAVTSSGAVAAPTPGAGRAPGVLAAAGALVQLGAIHAVRPIVDGIAAVAGAVSGTAPSVAAETANAAAVATQAVVAKLAEAQAQQDALLASWLRQVAGVAASLWQEVAGSAHASNTAARTVRAVAAGQAAPRVGRYLPGRVAATGAAAATTAARLRAVAVDVGQQLGVTVPAQARALRERNAALQRQYDRLHAEQQRIGAAVTGEGATAMVATALASLGMDWLRCRGVRNLGRGLCGAPSGWLDDLLALLVDFVAFEGLCDVLPLLTTAASDIGVPLVEGIAGVANAGTCGGAERSPALHVPLRGLPPVEGVPHPLAA